MKVSTLALVCVVALALGGVLGSRLSAQTMQPRVADARYRLVAEDFIARPDGRAVVDQAKVWTLVDQRTQQCVTVLLLPGGVTTIAAGVCPP